MTAVVCLDTEPGESSQTEAALRRSSRRLAEHGVEVVLSDRAPRRSNQRCVVSVDRSPPDEDLLQRGDLRVVASVRPPAARLFAAWTYEVEQGLGLPYEDWLSGVLDPATGGEHTGLLRPERLLQRWTRAIGAERVTVLLDPAPKRRMRALERRLAVPAGTLRPVRTARRLSAPEAELIRVINERFTEEDWPEDVRARYVAASIRALKRSGRRQPPPAPVPEWAHSEALRLATGTTGALDRLAVRVVGDRSRLSTQPGEPPPAPTLPTGAAARAVAAAIDASPTSVRSPLLDEAGARRLLTEVARRSRGRIRRRTS